MDCVVERCESLRRWTVIRTEDDLLPLPIRPSASLSRTAGVRSRGGKVIAMSLKDARADILARLVLLDAAGEEGFEGLLRDAMAEVTCMGFHLSKSGPQGGADVRTDPSNGVQIGLEAKRYRQSTRLPLDQLKAKIIDAADQPKPPDVWVLAASRSISGTDREVLMGVADKQGLGLLVLDWPGGVGRLPDLAVLLAAAPGALATHLSSPPLDAAFDAIRDHAD